MSHLLREAARRNTDAHDELLEIVVALTLGPRRLTPEKPLEDLIHRNNLLHHLARNS